MSSVYLVIKNFVACLLVRGLDSIYALVCAAILGRYLGASLYGSYAFIVSFVLALMPLVTFGIHPLMVRELAVRKASGRNHFGAALALRLVFATVVSVITLVSLPYMNLGGTHQLALSIYLFSELSLVFFRILCEVFVAFERVEIETYLISANRLLSLTSLSVICYYDLGFIAIFWTYACFNTLLLVFGFFIMRRNFFHPELSWEPDLLKFWVKEGWTMAIALSIMEYFLRIDIFVLQMFRSPEEIAYFEAPYKIIAKMYLISGAVTVAFSPRLARLAQNDFQRFKLVVEQGLKALLAVVIPLSFLSITVGPQAIVLLMGPSFAPAGGAMEILSLCLFFTFFEPFLSGTLILLKRSRAVLLTNLSALGINLVLDLLWVPKDGYIGACYANVFAAIALFCIGLSMLYHYTGGISPVRIAGRIAPGFAAVVVCIFLSEYIKAWNAVPPLWGAILGGMLGVAVYTGLMVLGKVFTRNDMELLREQ